MHSPEYTAQIKDLIAAKAAAEESMKRILFHFRNGRKPSPEDIAYARNYWAQALAIVDPEYQKSFDLVVEAAGSWQDELTTYIIPADEDMLEEDSETTEGHRNQADEIGIAIAMLTGQTRE